MYILPNIYIYIYLYIGQELKSSYSNKSFLLLNDMFRKNEKS